MEARFAGSQRVGDRRRRRLAVGADENADNPNTDSSDRPIELSALAGNYLAVDSAHASGLQTGPSLSLHLPIAKIIPAEGWKYLVGGLLGLAFSAAIIITGCLAPRIQVFAGPGITELFALPNGRVVQWFSSLLLLLCAQLALITWWTRSHSLEDFEGRYWLWIRTACVWLVFSGCVSIEAHNVALKTLLNIRPGLSRTAANLGWMIPAATLGALLVGALVREMRGCRASRSLLLLACACQLSAAGLHLELESFFSSAVRALLVQVGVLTGHVALFVSMWLHARHVLHCTAEPAPLPRRTWRIPRPHFRLSSFRLSQWRSMQARQNGEKSAEPQRPLKEPKSAGKRPVRDGAEETANHAASEALPSGPAAPQQERPSKPRIRLDNRHLEHSRHDAPEVSEDSAGETDAESTTGRNGSADSDEASDDGVSRPEMRGLSKKQRRRLMQELRDRERESTR